MSEKFRTEMTQGIWYWGGTGSGKSQKAFENYTPETHYILSKDKGWWDGYTQQPIVIIDNFIGEIKYNELFNLVDKWPYCVKRRGKPPMPFTSKTVIITSLRHPEEVLLRSIGTAKPSFMVEQLLIRFTIKKLNNLEHDKQ